MYPKETPEEQLRSAAMVLSDKENFKKHYWTAHTDKNEDKSAKIQKEVWRVKLILSAMDMNGAIAYVNLRLISFCDIQSIE